MAKKGGRSAAEKFIARKTKEFNGAIKRCEEICKGYRKDKDAVLEENLELTKRVKELENLADIQVEAIREMMKVSGLSKELLETIFEEKRAKIESSRTFDAMMKGPFGKMITGEFGGLFNGMF